MGISVLARGALLLVPAMACLLPCASAPAQAQPLALQQVVRYALQNNGELNAFREEKGVRDAGRIQAGLLPNPTLEVEGATGLLTGSGAENSLSVGVSQEFLLSGKVEKRVSVAERELEIYRWQLADRERVLRAEVKAAYFDTLLAEERIALAGRAVELNRQLYEVARERLAAGDIPELEMNLVKVELARSEGSRIEAAELLNRIRAKLRTVMGLPVGEAPAIAGTLQADSAVQKPLAELKRLAREKRPDLKALEAEKGRGEADIALAQTEEVPNLTAGLALTRDTTSMEIGGIEGKDTAYTVGFKLSMPIHVFDKRRTAVQEARARRNSAESRLTAVGRTVEREVETAYASYLNAEKVLSLYRGEIIPQLEENLQLTQEAYRLGEVGILPVFDEQRKFIEVNGSYLAALHDRQLAFSRLESAVATDFTGGVQ